MLFDNNIKYNEKQTYLYDNKHNILFDNKITFQWWAKWYQAQPMAALNIMSDFLLLCQNPWNL